MTTASDFSILILGAFLTGEKLKEERERAKSIANIAQTLINNGELALKVIKHSTEYGEEFIPDILTIGETENENT